MKSTDYATIKLTCRPNLLNSRPQRIGFYSKLEIPACIQGLTDVKLGARVSKMHDRISITHALVFIIFSGCATLESVCAPRSSYPPCYTDAIGWRHAYGRRACLASVFDADYLPDALFRRLL